MAAPSLSHCKGAVDVVDKITLPPWQKLIAPDAVIVGGVLPVTVTTMAEEVTVHVFITALSA